jgi:hypothetical protein
MQGVTPTLTTHNTTDTKNPAQYNIDPAWDNQTTYSPAKHNMNKHILKGTYKYVYRYTFIKHLIQDSALCRNKKYLHCCFARSTTARERSGPSTPLRERSCSRTNWALASNLNVYIWLALKITILKLFKSTFCAQVPLRFAARTDIIRK